MSGYFQVKIDEKSSFLMTFLLPKAFFMPKATPGKAQLVTDYQLLCVQACPPLLVASGCHQVHQLLEHNL
jgi:hypothetical protein